MVRTIEPGWAVLIAEGPGGRDTVLVAAALRFASITAGEGHVCGLTENGDAYCWGDNYSGELGIGHAGDTEYAPLAVTSGLEFESLALGDNHTCGITTGKEVYCWGDGSAGQLGIGEIPGRCTDSGFSECVPSPERVATGVRFTSISAGWEHTCAISVAAEIYCWGDNGDGQLGTAVDTDCGGRKCTMAPARSESTAKFKSIASGWRHSCALDQSGAAFCWGTNFQNAAGGVSGTHYYTPVAVNSTLRFDTLDAGFLHTCALTAAGEPYCWGSNDSGQLGVSYATAETSPVPIAVGGNQDFTQISTSFFASCGLEHEGRTICWGNPGTPAATGGDIRLRTLTTGTNYMCGTASTGAAYCWGFNAPGMGVRTGRADATPVVPPGPLPEILGAL